ncbi:MAG: hypothetical protein J0H68_01815 [Sphingobacteriia bacterium]|nr:hypothetical protein [Sphingobacteriia bacterium]
MSLTPKQQIFLQSLICLSIKLNEENLSQNTLKNEATEIIESLLNTDFSKYNKYSLVSLITWCPNYYLKTLRKLGEKNLNTFEISHFLFKNIINRIKHYACHLKISLNELEIDEKNIEKKFNSVSKSYADYNPFIILFNDKQIIQSVNEIFSQLKESPFFENDFTEEKNIKSFREIFKPKTEKGPIFNVYFTLGYSQFNRHNL